VASLVGKNLKSCLTPVYFNGKLKTRIVILEKVTATEIVEEFPAFSVTSGDFTVFKTARNRPWSYANSSDCNTHMLRTCCVLLCLFAHKNVMKSVLSVVRS
jgi:hypothetical protein